MERKLSIKSVNVDCDGDFVVEAPINYDVVEIADVQIRASGNVVIRAESQPNLFRGYIAFSGKSSGIANRG